MSQVDIKQVVKRYGPVEVLKGIDLTVGSGQFCALLGQSGCGKSTLLRMIAGIETITEGDIDIAGVRVNNLTPAERRIAMVFQSYALYPHMTVRENIAFSLRIAKVPKEVKEQRTRKVAEMLHLEHLLDRRPAQLSGGQRQRVAMGRALVRDPQVFLFDEPLSNLDTQLRTTMRLEIAKLHQEVKTTMIYVTHDQVEAMTLADIVVVMNKGEISQVGPPLELYQKPANKFVASFIGSPPMNFIKVDAQTADGRDIAVKLPGAGGLAVRARGEFGQSALDGVEMGIRPEHIGLASPGSSEASVDGRVRFVERLGNTSIIYVDTPAGEIVVQRQEDVSAALNDTVALVFDAQKAHIFGKHQAAL